MSRRRYRYVTNEAGEVVPVEVSASYEGHGDASGRVELMLDSHYDGLRATDGTPIDSRAKHREYMRRNNLTTVDDFKETWAKAAERRAQVFTEGGTAADRASRRAAVERAFAQAERSGRR
ncbi:MAG TPA: hypothetical protein VFP50_15350 [Anaeromyxobacteraceae bacterium]|nr:hypothetical protein [Anaeromyxobacteraceae bacterium]